MRAQPIHPETRAEAELFERLCELEDGLRDAHLAVRRLGADIRREIADELECRRSRALWRVHNDLEGDAA